MCTLEYDGICESWSNPSIYPGIIRFWNKFIRSSNRWKTPIISYNTFSPWEFPRNGVQPSSSSLVLSCIFPIVHTPFYFFHIPFISFQRSLDGEWVGKGKRSVFIGFWLWSFWVSWVILAAAHFGFQTLSYFPYFSRFPFISLQRALDGKRSFF